MSMDSKIKKISLTKLKNILHTTDLSNWSKNLASFFEAYGNYRRRFQLLNLSKRKRDGTKLTWKECIPKDTTKVMWKRSRLKSIKLQPGSAPLRIGSRELKKSIQELKFWSGSIVWSLGILETAKPCRKVFVSFGFTMTGRLEIKSFYSFVEAIRVLRVETLQRQRNI